MEHPKVVALGEFGLDEKWAERGILMDTQKDVFRSQVQMALKVNKPMVLHLRGYGALDSAKYILEEENVPKNWPIHLHAFTYSIDICKEWAEEYTSMKFGLVSENFDPEIVKNMPLNRLLLETDSPYFYPKELGNKGISIPNYISFVAKEIAHYKGIETYDVLDANLDNVNELYNIPSRNVIQKSEKNKKSFKEKRKEYRNQWKSENNSDTTNTEEQYPPYKPKKYDKRKEYEDYKES